MKMNNIITACVLVLFSGGIMSCEQHAAMESIVHEDGSITRTVMIQDVDSSKVSENIFGVSRESGWDVSMSPLEKNKYNILFTRTFPSAEAANAQMNPDDEARFKVRSEIKKDFRWFYTYYKYSDTYIALNRLHGIDPEDYFTAEDYSFIDRLPGEGKAISKADSFFLSKLNDRIYDDFAARGYYEENFAALLRALEEVNIAPHWIDSVRQKKSAWFQELLKSETLDDDNFLHITEWLNMPLDKQAFQEVYKKHIQDFERRSDFMAHAASTQIVHSIQVPWALTATNADSVASGRLFWNPPAVKYVVKDYTMWAEGRSFNVWAGATSLIVIGVALWMFVRPSKKVTIT